MGFTPPPPVPQRSARATFSGLLDTFLRWMSALPAELNAFLARLEVIAAGGAYAIPYVYSPASQNGALNTDRSGAQSITPFLTVWNTLADGTSALPLLQQFDTSSSTIKGQIRLVKIGDPSKWLVFNLTSRVGMAGGYQALYGSVVSTSSTNPFADGDAIMLYFQRTGDKGDIGNADKKVQNAPAPVNGVVTVDYRQGNCLVWNPASGSTATLNITNWPAAGTLGEFWIIGTNLGAATVNLGAPINWLRPDGTYANTASINTNHGATLRSAGEDNVLLWGRAGDFTNGKVAR